MRAECTHRKLYLSNLSIRLLNFVQKCPFFPYSLKINATSSPSLSVDFTALWTSLTWKKTSLLRPSITMKPYRKMDGSYHSLSLVLLYVFPNYFYLCISQLLRTVDQCISKSQSSWANLKRLKGTFDQARGITFIWGLYRFPFSSVQKRRSFPQFSTKNKRIFMENLVYPIQSNVS